MGQRFTPKAGYTCSVLTAYVAVYGDAIKGNPGMRVTLYDDDGFGFPGTERGYVDVAAADLPHAGMYYVTIDLSTLNSRRPFCLCQCGRVPYWRIQNRR